MTQCVIYEVLHNEPIYHVHLMKLLLQAIDETVNYAGLIPLHTNASSVCFIFYTQAWISDLQNYYAKNRNV